MTFRDFLTIIYANRDLLGDCGEMVNPEDTHPAAFCKGCPLRAAMVVHFGCPCIDYWVHLYGGNANKRYPVNPDPQCAAKYLKLDHFFTQAVADAWDGYIYLDAEADDDWRKQFAGALISVTLRPAPLELPA